MHILNFSVTFLLLTTNTALYYSGGNSNLFPSWMKWKLLPGHRLSLFIKPKIERTRNNLDQEEKEKVEEKWKRGKVWVAEIMWPNSFFIFFAGSFYISSFLKLYIWRKRGKSMGSWNYVAKQCLEKRKLSKNGNWNSSWNLSKEVLWEDKEKVKD